MALDLQTKLQQTKLKLFGMNPNDESILYYGTNVNNMIEYDYDDNNENQITTTNPIKPNKKPILSPNMAARRIQVAYRKYLNRRRRYLKKNQQHHMNLIKYNNMNDDLKLKQQQLLVKNSKFEQHLHHLHNQYIYSTESDNNIEDYNLIAKKSKNTKTTNTSIISNKNINQMTLLKTTMEQNDLIYDTDYTTDDLIRNNSKKLILNQIPINNALNKTASSTTTTTTTTTILLPTKKSNSKSINSSRSSKQSNNNNKTEEDNQSINNSNNNEESISTSTTSSSTSSSNNTTTNTLTNGSLTSLKSNRNNNKSYELVNVNSSSSSSNNTTQRSVLLSLSSSSCSSQQQTTNNNQLKLQNKLRSLSYNCNKDTELPSTTTTISKELRYSPECFNYLDSSSNLPATHSIHQDILLLDKFRNNNNNKETNSKISSLSYDTSIDFDISSSHHNHNHHHHHHHQRLNKLQLPKRSLSANASASVSTLSYLDDTETDMLLNINKRTSISTSGGGGGGAGSRKMRESFHNIDSISDLMGSVNIGEHNRRSTIGIGFEDDDELEKSFRALLPSESHFKKSKQINELNNVNNREHSFLYGLNDMSQTSFSSQFDNQTSG